MRGMSRMAAVIGLLVLALLPMMAAVSPEAARSALEGNMPVAIAQPLTAMDGKPLVAMPLKNRSSPMLPESGMLMLVGSALIGLAAIVRKTM